MRIKGASAAIDSCSGLIAQQAYRTYRKLPREHKRWVDPEDVMQEALMEAVRAERRYDSEGGAKYSTYLYRGLTYDLSKTYSHKLRLQKRHAVSMSEIDAPLHSESATTMDVPDRATLIGDALYAESRALTGIQELCGSVSGAARVLAVKVFLLGKSMTSQDWGVVSELRDAVITLGLQWGDFSGFEKSQKMRQIALNQLLRSGIVGSSVDTDVKILECSDCQGLFSLGDVKAGRYFVSATTCRVCYSKLAKSASCFGHRKGADSEGYSDTDIDCRLHCGDKVACKEFSERGIQMPKTKSKPAPVEVESEEDNAPVDEIETEDIAVEEEVEEESTEDELADVDFEEAAEEVTPVAKSAKSAKPKAKKVAVADDEPAPPAPLGEWPWKKGSVMRWQFQSALNGIKRDKLEELLKAGEHNVANMLKQLRSGVYRRKGTDGPLITWKLNEEGGLIRPYDLKYFGDGSPKASAPPTAPAKATPAVKVAPAKQSAPVATKTTKKAVATPAIASAASMGVKTAKVAKKSAKA